MMTILVLTDFSKAAKNAAIFAAALTHQVNTSKLFLLNSYEFGPITTEIPSSDLVSMANLKKESISKLELLRNELRPLISERTNIELIATESTLLFAVNTHIQEHHPALTIMGVTGMSSFERAIIGSNTISLAKEISSPLLLIPNEATFKKIMKVVFATDLNKTSYPTEIEIKAIIHALGAKLFILNVDHLKKDHLKHDMVTEQTELHKHWDSEDPEYYYIENDDTVEAIMDFAEKHEVQLVMTIPKKHGFFESIFHRSMTKKLAYHSHIPLLLFHEKN